MAFKDFIKSLPLDGISNVVGEVVFWWRTLVENIPADELPFQVYIVGSVIACLLWFFVARILPRPIGGMSWIVMIACLFTPGNSIDESGSIAPAIIAVFYSLMTKDFHQAAVKGLPILVVIVAGFFLGFIWQLIRDIINQMKEAQPEVLSEKAKSKQFTFEKFKSKFKKG